MLHLCTSSFWDRLKKQNIWTLQELCYFSKYILPSLCLLLSLCSNALSYPINKIISLAYLNTISVTSVFRTQNTYTVSVIWHGLRQASTTTITRFYVCKSEKLQGGRYILSYSMAVTILKSMIYCFKIEVSRQCIILR